MANKRPIEKHKAFHMWRFVPKMQEMRAIVWSSVQCETVYSAVNGQAGTLWMEGIMWPQHLPKQIFLTDCQQAHTRDQPIQTIPKRDSKWARRARKHHRVQINIDIRGSWGFGREYDAVFKRFYEWRLWYVNECDWEKNGIFSFSTLTLPQSAQGVFIKERLDWQTHWRCTILIDDYVRKSWRTAVTHGPWLSI